MKTKNGSAVGRKTMAMKSRFSNQVHMILKNEALSESQKLELILKIDLETSLSLHAYKAKRKRKALIQAEREKRNYTPKKRTSLKEWLAMCDQGVFVATV